MVSIACTRSDFSLEYLGVCLGPHSPEVNSYVLVGKMLLIACTLSNVGALYFGVFFHLCPREMKCYFGDPVGWF